MMICKQCGNEEHNPDKVYDNFHENYHSLCFGCAEQASGEDQYMRTHSYDVETPFAANH